MTFTYDHQFDCSGVTYTNGHGSYTYDNTATITETGQDSSASLTVDCYKLSRHQGCEHEPDSNHYWTILKSS